MNLDQCAEQIVNQFITDITDHLFVSIEQDDNKMREYMLYVRDYDLDNLNRAIGKKIKEKLSLENGEENEKPKSRLIKSYTRHSK
ncbi:MAG: hypothetical protein LBC76_01305 [Treponema sp.]|jgi:hypothetical protein|nr:hypothetical protein [Treponema sp.]